MEKLCGIYCIENLVNGKKYVGQSINLYSRLIGHKRKLINGTHKNKHLQRAFDIYGIDNFAFYIIEQCNEEELDEKERKYIAEWNLQNSEFGYNIESGGNKNKHLAQETRDKLSAAHTGKSCSQETRDKMSKSRMGEKNPMYGKHQTQEVRDLISLKNIGKTGHEISESQRQKARETNLGKIVSLETRDKISNANKGKTPHNKNTVSVYCIELNAVFNSASDVAKQLNITSYGILECCRHNRKTCGGYHWKYADEITNQYESNELIL